MEQSTPKKVHTRNSVCQLCGGAYESRHMLRIFGKSGIDKNLPAKIQDACGVLLSEDDCHTKLVCRKCEAFVFKVSDFKQKALTNIGNDLDLEQKCSVKRCSELSPSCKQQSKRPATKLPSKSSAKQLTFGENPTQENDKPKNSPSILTPENTTESLELPEVLDEEMDDNYMMFALNSKPPSYVAEIIRKHCPHVLSALASLISEDVNTACQKLCRRSDGSVLYGSDYESLKDFSFDRIWQEMETNIPFLITLMNAVSGKSSTTPDLRVKYSFLYSILMSERWHELSVVKRVNTVLVIEGGCTKKVRFI